MMYGNSEVSTILRVSRTTAYQLIRDLQEEMTGKGYVPSKSGTISAKYLWERYHLTEKECLLALSGAMLST